MAGAFPSTFKYYTDPLQSTQTVHGVGGLQGKPLKAPLFLRTGRGIYA